MTPVLLLGAGRMGGALIEGWRRTGAFAASDLLIRDPYPSTEALAAAADGATVNPPDADLARAQTVLLAVKPQVWREAAATYAPLLAPDAVIVSILVGVRLADLTAAFGSRRVARVMPTTGVLIAEGVASIVAGDAEAAARAHALFDPVATTVDLAGEHLMDVASAVSGSAPAFVYAFVEALETAGIAHGLSEDDARALVRATLHSASALLEHSGEEPAELRRQVTSPGGTTQAGLEVLTGDHGLTPLLDRTVAASIARARELAGEPLAQFAPPRHLPRMTDTLDRAGDAALTLAADRPWPEITLRDIAVAAELSFAQLYVAASTKGRVLGALSRRFDRAALDAADAQSADEDVHDRLFEVVMARIEAMEPHRFALIAIARAEGPLAIGPRLPRTARALLEGAGVDASGVRGGARLAAMTAVWARTLQVWRDDEGALNRTMAEIDKQLRAMRDRLGRVGAGF